MKWHLLTDIPAVKTPGIKSDILSRKVNKISERNERKTRRRTTGKVKTLNNTHRKKAMGIICQTGCRMDDRAQRMTDRKVELCVLPAESEWFVFQRKRRKEIKLLSQLTTMWWSQRCHVSSSPTATSTDYDDCSWSTTTKQSYKGLKVTKIFRLQKKKRFKLKDLIITIRQIDQKCLSLSLITVVKSNKQ